MGQPKRKKAGDERFPLKEICIAPLVSLVTVKNLPAMQENCVQSLGWEDPLEKGIATHSSINK